MTIDIAKVTELLEHHFATVTPEEFRANLEKFCPELFAEEEDKSNGNGNEDISLCGEDDRFGRADASRSPSPDRQLDLTAPTDEIYRQAKEDSKKEIAAKLLHRGISVKEVAEILELDVSSIA
jgi:uncharacterized protein (DUF1786 family)